MNTLNNSRNLFIYSQRIVNYAYLWRPYNKMPKLPSIHDIHVFNDIIGDASASIDSCDFKMSIKHTGILPYKARVFYVTKKHLETNIHAINCLLINKEPEKILQVFENKDNWIVHAKNAKNVFQELDRTCNKLFNTFMTIE